jgi:hypothetical protein
LAGETREGPAVSSIAKSFEKLSIPAWLLFLLLFLAWPDGAAAGDLGVADLQIAGTRLSVSPLGQTVPFDTPTIVETHLEGYDVGLGTLPADLRVFGEFSGPGIEGVVRLATSPNEPFRIPRLRTEGAYALSDIRLMQGDQLLAYAEPRSVSVNAAKVLIARVSARPLTRDEIDSYGIVIDESSYGTLNLTFGFAFEEKIIDYNMPVAYQLYDTDGDWNVPIEPIYRPDAVGFAVGGGTLPPRFHPPAMAPFRLTLPPREVPEIPEGGCDPSDECRKMESEELPPIIGVILFPTELTLLHQFFSVVLAVQNGAPEGDQLVLRDLSARLKVPSGLRPARTEPPTPLGVPVPLRVPGPDGLVGTADDLTFLIAQASAEAEVVVEGLREGTHLVEFDIAGTVDGLPGGPQPIGGKAQGAVVVRDPTLSVVISHPRTVKVNQEYPLYMTVTNLGKAPVNELDLGFKAAGLAGVEVIGDTEKTVGNLLPGDSRVVEFEMRSLIGGVLASSSARAGGATRPGFEIQHGNAGGIPLSPESLLLPNTSRLIPPALFKEGLALVGLAHSLAKAPPSVATAQAAADGIAATENEMNDRIYRLSQMGRQIEMGEELFDAAALLAVEWLGARDAGWEWDSLRRKTVRGREFARAMGEVLAAEVDSGGGPLEEAEVFEIAERVAASTHFLSPIVMGAWGDGVSIEIESRTSGKKVRGGTAPLRTLPFAELYRLAANGQMGMVVHPEEGGYNVRLRREGAGYLSFVLAMPATSAYGDLPVARFGNVFVPAGATLSLILHGETLATEIEIDEDGDGSADDTAVAASSQLEKRPFEVVKAIQNFEIDASGHVVDLLFSADLDLDSLLPRDPERFRIPGKVSNGGLTPHEASLAAQAGGEGVTNPLAGLFNPRIVRIAFNNPIRPGAGEEITVGGLRDAVGREIEDLSFPLEAGPGAPAGAPVTGLVIDPHGLPVPGAEVSLFQWDLQWTGDFNECLPHRIARGVADETGRFLFDYVRQGPCGERFRIEALAPGTPYWGKADGVIRYANSEHQLNVVMLGRGSIRGRITYADGSVPEGLEVFAHNPVFNAGRKARVEPDGRFAMSDVVVGTVVLFARDALGNRVFQTLELPTAGAEIVRDLTLLKQTATSAVATVRGRVTRPGGSEPVAGAFVSISLDGQALGSRDTDADGIFDFGSIPLGGIEVFVFDRNSGRLADQRAEVLEADENVFLEMTLREDPPGKLFGNVRRRMADGTVLPVADAVVYLEGLPFNTRADAAGAFEIAGLPPGNYHVRAADLTASEVVGVYGTVNAGGDTRVDLFFKEETSLTGTIEGAVVNNAGVAVAGALIHLAGDWWSTNWHHEAITDSQGRFRIENLQPGTYGVHAMGNGGAAIGWAHVRHAGDTANVGIRFTSAKVRGRTVARDADGNLFGVISRLSWRPVEVIREWALVAVARDNYEGITEDDGTFELDALPGPFSLSVHNFFHGTKSMSWVLGPDETIDVTIEFEVNGAIHGVLYDHDGLTPVAGAELRLTGGGFTNYQVHSDAEGKFTFDLIPPGAYLIYANDRRGGIDRVARIAAYVRRFGDELQVEVVLPKQGTVFGEVIDADGVSVPGAVVTLTGSNYPRQTLTQTTDADGFYFFTNVYAGNISLKASAPELGGLGGKAEMKVLSAEGEELQTEILLEGVGELVGQVIDPDDGSPVPNAEVRLDRSGTFFDYLVINTDFEGRFRFDRLPVGNYRMAAFDPSTGRRRGNTAWIPIALHGQVVEHDLYLEVRGEVEGHLYDSPSGQAIPGATISLYSRGFVSFITYSSTDADGFYEFGGIPEGYFRVYTEYQKRRASADGTIAFEDQVVVRDLHLDALARIEGSVRQPRTSAGPSAELAGQVEILLRDSRDRVIAATTENPFVMEGLVADVYRLEAREIGGEHRVDLPLRLQVGESRSADLELRAIGSLVVHVFEANGQPAANIDVRVDNHYKWKSGAANTDPYFPLFGQSFSASTGAGNEYAVPRVRQGWVTVSVKDPLYPLARRGSATAPTLYEGETLHLSVSLAPTGSVCGTVLQSDGSTPAEEAIVSIRPYGEEVRLRVTNQLGEFCFDNLPQKTFRLEASEADQGYGWRRIDDGLTVAAPDKTYTIVLDDAPPLPVAVSPGHLATAVPLAAPVVIEFSEAMCQTAACNAGAVLTKYNGSSVAVTRTWSTDGKTLTLRPTGGLLASDTGYRIGLRYALLDQAGRQLLYEQVTHFRTVDVTPPTVIDVLPRANAEQVPIATSLMVTFSEPLDGNLAPTNFQLLRVEQNNFSETLIATFIPENRRVALTVVPDLLPDQLYELRVTGVNDVSGNVMPTVFTSRFRTVDTVPPQVSWLTPAEGQSLLAGELVTLEVEASDLRGIAGVDFSAGERGGTVAAAPYKLALRMPYVTAPTDLEVRAVARDNNGNATTILRHVVVEPRPADGAPEIIATCPADGDWVDRGARQFQFQLRDDQAIESWKVEMGGATIGHDDQADETEVTAAVAFAVPAAAPAGATFTLVLTTRDFAGQEVSRTIEFEVPAVEPLRGTRQLASTGELVLGAGTFSLLPGRSFERVTLLQGALLESQDGGTLAAGELVRAQCGSTLLLDAVTTPRLTLETGSRLSAAPGGQRLLVTAGELIEIEAGARIDLQGQGYLAGLWNAPAGQAPPGVAGSSAAGGSHGGWGATATGSAGAIYDSVYRPTLAGGGGGGGATTGSGAGGGVLRLVAPQLVLGGDIAARGMDQLGQNKTATGAGGSIELEVGEISGGGLVDASGGDETRDRAGCWDSSGGGGGGRIGLRAATATGFDPASQLRSWGGAYRDANGHLCRFAGPGTVYTKIGAAVYGSLAIDAGPPTPAGPRQVRETPLPALGSGTGGLSAAGADAWLDRAEHFSPAWLGVYLQLRDAAGHLLGTYEAAERDAAGRLRLAGAGGSAAGAASWRGVYRFEQVDVRRGAGLAGADPVFATRRVLEGNAAIADEVIAEEVVVKAGAVVRPAFGSKLSFKVSGKMTVEAGARIDLSGMGYLGTTSASQPGGSPPGVAGAKHAGGSHGGYGYGTNGTSVLGETYDSVYQPQLPGGGGSGSLTPASGAGGGAISIEAGELELHGDLLARGFDQIGNGTASGAGGSIFVKAGALSGGGTIDAGGGDQARNHVVCAWNVGGGGGGRVALHAGTLNGFDPLLQLKALGGKFTNQNGELCFGAFAGPGTIFTKLGDQPYGDLLIDAGPAWNGVERSVRESVLPALGGGAPLALAAAGSDAWLTRAGGFAEHWLGVRVELKNAAGALLGAFEVVERDALGGLRLEGAAEAAAAAASYQGFYRFDQVHLKGGAGLGAGDRVVATDTLLENKVKVPARIVSDTVTVKSGARLRPVVGDRLELRVAGTLTVETGARIDLDGAGYAGSASSSIAGLAPPGVTGTLNAGGSHGGSGSTATGTPGPVYDSVYRPSLAGGGGSPGYLTHSNGGGAIDIEAGTVVLAGELLARGHGYSGDGVSAGAGGTVRIKASSLSGAGTIDAGGGEIVSPSCRNYVGGGGGGRVALEVDDLSSFDAAGQVRIFAGVYDCPTDRHAAPGTLYLKEADDTFGHLRIDAGPPVGGVGRPVMVTRLPTLGSGAVILFTSLGADARIAAAAAFAAAWDGAWIELETAGGASLGTFEVAAREASGALIVKGAGALSGVAVYRGRYRFDSVAVLGGAGLAGDDPIGGETTVISGQAQVDAVVTAADLVVASGAVVKPAAGGKLTFIVSGKMTVEAGATIDLSGGGYASSTSGAAATAPGATGSAGAGGSHGGIGYTATGTAGSVYDSVYRPQLGGGGGAVALSTSSGAGGGVLEIFAGELDLDGVLLARGKDQVGNQTSTGAGGTIALEVGRLTGSGTIDAGGGDETRNYAGCYNGSGGGGGGRIRIAAGTLDGFDPLVQARAWGGKYSDANGAACGTAFGGPGTLFVETAESTYGELYLDGGDPIAGSPRVLRETPLPSLGSGSATLVTAAGADAWISRSGAFAEHWLGAWVELKDGAGVVVGTFEAIARDGSGALRLAGAAALAGSTPSFRGIYRFDRLETRRGAGFSATDAVEAGLLQMGGATRVAAEVAADTVTVKSGATVRPASGSKVTFKVSGTLTVESGAKIDLSGVGYLGSNSQSVNGQSAPGFTGSNKAGGSHGGFGFSTSGTPGGVFDSVYRPQLPGGGGAQSVTAASGAGGGVLEIEAGSLVLEGDLLARGKDQVANGYATGAGGTIYVKAGSLSGGGAIDATGGNEARDNATCYTYSGGGGGGRVALEVTSLGSFDLASQVKAWGGTLTVSTGALCGMAGPGTLYVKKGASTYGDLYVDGGPPFGGVERSVRETPLPSLGAGSYSGLTPAGGDAWMARAGGFGEHWLGTWIELKDASGAVLGTYKAAERDGTGGLRLAGAAGVISSAASYRGVYRFDQVKVLRGAGLGASDPVAVTTAQLEGNAEVAAEVTASNLTVKSGATVRPISGSKVSFKVNGTLTVEAGAKIDLSGTGYLATTSINANAQTAPGFTGAYRSGGSHGGYGSTVSGGPAGGVYDSVYRPQLPGGGGGAATTTASGAGGGVLEIEAGTLVLAGELLARGKDQNGNGTSTGAGGTIFVKAGTLSGGGAIDATGGNETYVYATCYANSGAGGGGRVAFEVANLSGFDPDVQVKAWGGTYLSSTGVLCGFGSPGTVFLAGGTYGELQLDAGPPHAGNERSLRATELPALGDGAFSSLDAAGGDAWIARSGGFGEHWLGAWVELADSGGTLLGTFRAAERGGSANLRLAGAAGTISSAASYRGVYHFDQVELRRGAGLIAGPEFFAGAVELAGGAKVNRLQAGALTVKSGAVVRPASGGEVELAVGGLLTIESGAKIDLRGLGYAGTGGAPAGITGSSNAGGSHGGRGDGTTPSVTFDSVYRPLLGGGGGAAGGGHGGGVVRIFAGELALQGEILVQGLDPATAGSAGAGGTVVVEASELSGSGSIDATGGNVSLSGTCYTSYGGGGGGRVALFVPAFDGFDPYNQVKVWPGRTDCTGTASDRDAAPGTLYIKTAGSTYGKLSVDGGDPIGGIARSPKVTLLPTLGNGTLSTLTAAGGDAWLDRTAHFPEAWIGVWVELKDAGNNVLGTYEVIKRDSAGLLLLGGASGAVGTATQYRGFYRFDEVRQRQGALVQGTDTLDVGAYSSSTWNPGENQERGELEMLAGEQEERAASLSLGDLIYLDADGDGRPGAAEKPVEGVRLRLLDEAGEEIAGTASDRFGRYLFEGIEAGEYRLELDAASLPGGLAAEVNEAAAYRSRRDLDFGLRPLAPRAPRTAEKGAAPPLLPPAEACAAGEPVDLVVLLELGPQMTAPFAGAADRLEAAQLAIAGIERKLAARGDGSRFALVTTGSYGGGVELELRQGLSPWTSSFEDRLLELAAEEVPDGEGRPAAHGLRYAADLLAGGEKGRARRILVVTDGWPGLDAKLQGNGDQAAADLMGVAEEAAVEQPGLKVYGLLLGEKAELQPLDYAAKLRGGQVARAAEVEGLEAAVERLAAGLGCSGEP